MTIELERRRPKTVDRLAVLIVAAGVIVPAAVVGMLVGMIQR